MTSNLLAANPYIGSRSFQRGERLYGRDAEARDLMSLLVSERIVLLHSPSGAGKTSLIQAALIPRLERRNFRVRPPIRVNRMPERPGNRYVQSVIASLEDDPELPAATQLSDEELATISLDAYLQRRRLNPDDEDEDQVLIFDQFEEVLTVDPIDLAEKHAFFRELGVALRRLNRWALFAIREDYLAALSPFVRPLPTRLSNTFRLDLLGLDAARRAMQGPAEDTGVDFTAEAANQLAENLARIVVTGRNGEKEERIGLTVEPVQLQVVCRRLWDQRFADEQAGSGDAAVAVRPTITVRDVEALGSVDQALSDYYSDGIGKAVAAGGDERIVRGWFERDLITRQGIRGQVLYGSEQMRNLSDAVINALRNVYLIRADERRGSTWYELAHDRLIDPVRENNRHWFEANLSPLQRQTELWVERGQPDSLLFRGAELDAAEAWAQTFGGTLNADERSFLEKSRAEQARARRLRNLTIGAVAAAAVASVAFVVALLFFGQARANERLATENYNKAVTQEALALEQKGIAETNAAAAVAAEATAVANYELAEANRRAAEQQARISKARELAAASLSRLPVDPELSVLLGIEAMNATEPVDPEVPAAFDALQQAANTSRIRYTETFTNTFPYRVAYSSTGAVAASLFDGRILYWPNGTISEPPQSFVAHTGFTIPVAFSPDGRLLYTGGQDAFLRVWRVADLDANTQPTPLGETNVFSNTITRIAPSPDGESVALAGTGPDVMLLDAASLERRQTLQHGGRAMRDVAFHPDGNLIATAGFDGSVKIWDLSDGSLYQTLSGTTAFNAVQFIPQRNQVITADNSGRIAIWNLADQAGTTSSTPLLIFNEHTDNVVELFYDPQTDLAYSAGVDTRILVWDLARQRRILALGGHRNSILGLAVNRDRRLLVTASQDGTLREWTLGLQQPIAVDAMALHPDRSRIASGGQDGVIRLWDRADGRLVNELIGHTNTIRSLAFNTDGSNLLSAGDDGLLISWDVAGGTERWRVNLEAGRVNGLAVNPVSGIIATADDQSARIWSADGQLIRELGRFEQRVREVAFNPDGQLLAVAIGNTAAQIKLYRAPNWDEVPLAFPELPSQQVNQLTFSPDNRELVVVGTLNTITIIPLDQPDQARTISGHGSEIFAAAYLADGTQLATTSKDETIRIWDARSGTSLQNLSMPIAVKPSTMRIDTATETLIIGGSDGIIRMIPLGRDDLFAFATTRVSRPDLTPDECNQYNLASPGCEQ